MIVLTLTDWPIRNGSIQESGLFYIFQIIRSYLQSKHIDRIGLHLHTKDMLFYMLLNTKTLIILLHLDDSRKKNIEGYILYETGICEKWRENKVLSTQQSPVGVKSKKNDDTSNGIINQRDKSHVGEKVLVLSRRDKGGGVKRCLAQ